jgi:V/A-type H+-transporting ATPase subunit A
MSGRLEEIPGEEAFPAYLESVIAAFYERGGIVKLKDGSFGSVTIGGTVSPAGGNFDEPVTQATLKVVGAFHGLSRARSDARRYPAIDPLDSWSKYPSTVDVKQAAYAHELLKRGTEIGQMMKVVGEEGTAMKDFIIYLKSEYLDATYLQQDAFNEIDGATDKERQQHVFALISDFLKADLQFDDKETGRSFFHKLTQLHKDWNRTEMQSEEFKKLEEQLRNMVAEVSSNA